MLLTRGSAAKAAIAARGTPAGEAIGSMSRSKLDPSQFAPEIIPYLLVTLCERAVGMGIAPERLCAGLGFDLPALRAGVLVSRRQAWRMIRRALQLGGRDDLGIEVGLGQGLEKFGLLGEAFVTAPDVGGAIRLGARHYPAGGALVDIELAPSTSGLALELRPRVRDPRLAMFLVEELLASVLDLFRRELGEPLVLHALELGYPAPAHAPRYRELFGCEPRFGGARSRLELAPDWLARPMPRHDPAVSANIRAQLEQHARQETLDTVAAIERLLARPGGMALSIAQLARSLDLSPRTLRRRLDEAGTSFRAISGRVRAQAARELLEAGGLTVAEAGARLGFSVARAFRRAFKRWQGQAPGELRQPR